MFSIHVNIIIKFEKIVENLTKFKTTIYLGILRKFYKNRTEKNENILFINGDNNVLIGFN